MAIAGLKEGESRTGRHNSLRDCPQEIYPMCICHLAQYSFGVEQINLLHLHS